ATGNLKNLIGIAFEIPPNLASDILVGGPKFLDTDRYNIVAKTPSSGIGAPTREGGREVAPPIDVALKMLRTLLEERFKLVTHKENRQVTAYALQPPKGETKLKKADSSERANCRPDPGAIPANTGGVPMQAGTCTNTTIEEFARILPQIAGAYFDHPVVDATGLQGGWSFPRHGTPRGALEPARPGPADPVPLGGAPDAGGVATLHGLAELLGLEA